MATIKIPSSICSMIEPAFNQDSPDPLMVKSIRSAAKSLIEAAIHDGLPAAALPTNSESGVSVSVTFPAPESRHLRHFARQEGIREGDAALRFLYAAIARGDLLAYRVVNTSFMDRFTQARGLNPRHAQTVFADAIFQTLGSNNIGMIEASTGVGKTMAIIAACSEFMSGRSLCRVLVTVPSLRLLQQFANEHRRLEAIADLSVPHGRFIVGRNEFISVEEVHAVLSAGTEPVDPAPILQWLSSGGPAVGEAQALQSAYLSSSLRTISPEFPIDAVRLRIDTPLTDPGAQAYALQFERDDERERGSEILYCTHAMVAVDIRRRRFIARNSAEGRQARETAWADVMDESEALFSGARKDQMRLAIDKELHALARLSIENDVGILPAWQHLVIDEAHDFERNVANTLSTNVSMGSFVRHLRKISIDGHLSKAAVLRAEQALEILRKSDECDGVDLTVNTTAIREIRASLQVFSDSFKSIKAAGKTHLLYTQLAIQARAIDLALQVTNGEYGHRAFITYSPVRMYPQLSVGRRSVAGELQFLWHIPFSAVAVSATLYLRRLDKDSAMYSASIMNVPSQRIQEFPVIRPDWIVKPVTGLWVPEAHQIEGRWWLRPPTRSDKLDAQGFVSAEAVWIEELVRSLERIHASAEGGVLVLLSSYALAASLAKDLESTLAAMVVASSSLSLQQQLAKFGTLRATGEKAMWLAVGGAWTGLDINGEQYGIADAANDNLLTDLVIPRFPFGMNRSITHRSRIETKPDIPWELLDSVMRLKQGFGRLVRREGLPTNRRIFVLDGRINDPIFHNYLSHFRRLMGSYPQRIWNVEDAI